MTKVFVEQPRLSFGVFMLVVFVVQKVWSIKFLKIFKQINTKKLWCEKLVHGFVIVDLFTNSTIFFVAHC